jgi:hypothetical protein
MTKTELYTKISNVEDIDVKTVRSIFKSAENIIFEYLSSTTPNDSKKIHIMDGLCVGSKVIPYHEKINPNTKQNIIVGEKIKVFSYFTRKYKDKVNKT